MKKKVKCVDVRTADGTPILHLYLSDQEIVLGESPTAPPPARKHPSSANSRSQSPNNTNDGSEMTEAQKRYLFRLLAERGLEGDTAHEHLKELFQVDSLEDATKVEASRLIERLLEETERAKA